MLPKLLARNITRQPRLLCIQWDRKAKPNMKIRPRMTRQIRTAFLKKKAK